MQKKIRITDLLYPHWGTLALAFIAVLGESITDLLEPWPLKIVFDHVFGSKRLPGWYSGQYLGMFSSGSNDKSNAFAADEPSSRCALSSDRNNDSF